MCSHSLLDQKINNVLSISNDQAILKAIQSIIQNMLATEDPSQQQLHFLQSCGFGGLWRFAGPFTKISVSLILPLSIKIETSSSFLPISSSIIWWANHRSYLSIAWRQWLKHAYRWRRATKHRVHRKHTISVAAWIACQWTRQPTEVDSNQRNDQRSNQTIKSNMHFMDPDHPNDSEFCSAAFSSESLDGHDGFRGSLSSLRRGSASRPRAASIKHRLAENPLQTKK